MKRAHAAGPSFNSSPVSAQESDVQDFSSASSEGREMPGGACFWDLLHAGHILFHCAPRASYVCHAEGQNSQVKWPFKSYQLEDEAKAQLESHCQYELPRLLMISQYTQNPV